MVVSVYWTEGGFTWLTHSPTHPLTHHISYTPQIYQFQVRDYYKSNVTMAEVATKSIAQVVRDPEGHRCVENI